ncbi:MAG: hypothetical protein DMG65_11715 [Candidatus Angelobacter sp. Gp1-AA117]|nr:MAG: hypothetical protein DMG65_11715 [Candidatus Angelobacter sp. Gp1-AA117]
MVLGEGLAAGVGDFTLTAETQMWSFPAQMARQMGADLPTHFIQAPGLGDFPGFQRLSVRIPAPLQTTVLSELPPKRVANLSVPGFRVHDAASLCPLQPLIHRTDARQTAANLMWGILSIAYGERSAPTQLEYALQQSPTFVIVELGYYEALEAAVHENPGFLPNAEELISQYSEIIRRLKDAGAEVLALNIPDPFDTAHFSSVETAARIAKVEPSFLYERYEIKPGDVVTLNGLNEIGFQIFSRSLGALHPDALISAGAANEISSRIAEINERLAQLVQDNGALLYDIAGLFRRVGQQGYHAGNRTLTGEYMGGFYSLNGYYPGQTGQAIIANEILQLLNAHYGATFNLIDLNAVVGSDPAAACRQAEGPNWSSAELRQLPFDPDAGMDEALFNASTEDDDQRFSVEDNWEQLAPLTPPQPSTLPLRLPPGLEQVLPLNASSSYFGDGISALNVRNPQEQRFGSTADFIFGGLAMVDSHLSGFLKTKFSEPVNHISHFELSFMSGFTGEDSVLVAPQFFKMAFQNNRVDEAQGLVSSGDLDLETGEVFNLTVYAQYGSAALQILVGVNPTAPWGPVTFRNPPPSNCPPPTPEQQQIYASAWAEFQQRPDGLLDFTFYGSMFVPLGPRALWPLNFVSASGQHAVIPASGTVMHPHLQLSTRDTAGSSDAALPPIPFNTIQEFTLFTHNSAFGDAFHLNAPHLGGPAKGRSHLLGRLQIQFGPRTQNSVPMAVWSVPAGGIMAPLPPSPITDVFPSRLSPGPQGFNEFLRFPMRNYALDDLSIIDDPFDISVGALDLRNGRMLNSMLHRAFISQDLIFALLRVEPCTPQSSFFFRGPAVLVKGPRNQKVFRFQGIVHIPYPEGLKFPNPDFATGFAVGPNSSLDPFLWFHAIRNGSSEGIVKEGSENQVRASTGDVFSYSYRIAADPMETPPLFEYQNHSQQGCFRLHSLAWVDFSNSGTSTYDDDYDTVSFSGFGLWSKDGTRTVQQAAVQICTSAGKPYVGIQIAQGDISNVNTKPAIEQEALP